MFNCLHVVHKYGKGMWALLFRDNHQPDPMQPAAPAQLPAASAASASDAPAIEEVARECVPPALLEILSKYGFLDGKIHSILLENINSGEPSIPAVFQMGVEQDSVYGWKTTTRLTLYKKKEDRDRHLVLMQDNPDPSAAPKTDANTVDTFFESMGISIQSQMTMSADGKVSRRRVRGEPSKVVAPADVALPRQDHHTDFLNSKQYGPSITHVVFDFDDRDYLPPKNPMPLDDKAIKEYLKEYSHYIIESRDAPGFKVKLKV
jgi:hypothetical protein